MGSFTRHPRSDIRYGPKPGSLGEETGNGEFSAALEIHIHHARNIHNICIYDNQDVYAKFSLTCDPDKTLATSVIKGGGKNPDFDERLSIKVNQPDSVLKCEMWMLSRARNYLKDQLLGFALVQLWEIVGKGKVTADYSLSSTDLFHSPAGTVRLSLSLDATSLPVDPLPATSSITSEVVLLDRIDPDLVEYSRIEFPDINAAAENHQMVSEYFTSGSRNNDPNGIASFLHLGSCPLNPRPLFEYDMSGNSSDNNSISTTTSLSEERNSPDSIKKKGLLGSQEPSISPNPETDRSSAYSKKKANEAGDLGKGSSKVEEGSNSKEGKSMNPGSNNGGLGGHQVFPVNLDAEQSTMQQQIVGMYMRSMQQFTESLANMKLPMDIDKLEQEENLELEQTKDGSRVFYGSRAFF